MAPFIPLRQGRIQMVEMVAAAKVRFKKPSEHHFEGILQICQEAWPWP